jgi:hypothetical protein
VSVSSFPDTRTRKCQKSPVSEQKSPISEQKGTYYQLTLVHLEIDLSWSKSALFRSKRDLLTPGYLTRARTPRTQHAKASKRDLELDLFRRKRDLLTLTTLKLIQHAAHICYVQQKKSQSKKQNQPETYPARSPLTVLSCVCVCVCVCMHVRMCVRGFTV